MTEDERLAAWRDLQWATSLIMGRFGRDLAEHDLSLEEFDVLVHLAWTPNGVLPLRRLVASMVLGYQLSRSGLTRLLDRMEREDLVERSLSHDDRRQFDVRLTERGRATFDRVWPGHLRGVEQYFSFHLTDGDVAALRKVLRKLIRANEPTYDGTAAGRRVTNTGRSSHGTATASAKERIKSRALAPRQRRARTPV